MIIIIIIVIINIVITIWSIIYLKYYLEYNCGNKIISILTFRKLFTNLTQKVMSTPKIEMKSKYETGSSCTPVNKTGIKNVSVATLDTQLFAISTSKATEKILNKLQKQIYKIEISECA